MCSSASFLAEISVRSPWKWFIFHYLKKYYLDQSIQKNILFYFENSSTDVQLSAQPIQEVPSPLVCSSMVGGYKASIQLCTHELATGNAFVQIEVATTNLSGVTKTVCCAYGSSREGSPEQARRWVSKTVCCAEGLLQRMTSLQAALGSVYMCPIPIFKQQGEQNHFA